MTRGGRAQRRRPRISAENLPARRQAWQVLDIFKRVSGTGYVNSKLRPDEVESTYELGFEVT